MSNLRAIYRPHTVFSSITCCCRDIVGRRSIVRLSIGNHNFTRNRFSKRSADESPWFDFPKKVVPWAPFNQRRHVMTSAYDWKDSKSPYETLELERNADDEQIKVAYRRLAKFYHPDVYDGRGDLEEGETAETRFIKIQAAYELLIDQEQRRQYDYDNRVNPMKASQAWVEWLMKKRKAFDQRGDMAVAGWAAQQQMEINLKARRLARSKVDPEEERRIREKEKKAYMDNYQTTLRRHTLVLKRRDIMRKKAEEERKKEISRLLADEGLELDDEESQ